MALESFKTVPVRRPSFGLNLSALLMMITNRKFTCIVMSISATQMRKTVQSTPMGTLAQPQHMMIFSRVVEHPQFPSEEDVEKHQPELVHRLQSALSKSVHYKNRTLATVEHFAVFENYFF